MLTLADLEAVVDEGVRVGTTDLAPFPLERDRIVQSVANGHNGGLGFTYASPDRSTSPASSFPWACSIVVIAVPYLMDGDATAEHRTIARFADGDRYVGVKKGLGEIADVLAGAGFRAEAVFDDDRLVDRAVAVRAGIAWNGKSTMVLTPLDGPWILIGSVVTDAPFDPTPPMVRSCGTCVACMPACPTGAIVAPGVLDASLCLAAVLQRPGSIPPELRAAIGSRVYGCDECLVACPPGGRALSQAGETADQPPPAEILGMSDDEIDDAYHHWYVPKRKMRFVRRNALVALGNAASTSDLGIVAGYLGHPDPLLRGHAAWAAGRIGGVVATRILESAGLGESEPLVVAEIAAAMAFTSDGSVYADGSNVSRSGGSEPE